MNTEKFKGVFPAFYACYDDNGEISAERTQLLAKHLMEKGVKGLYVGGSSGECIYQSVEDRKKILENVMKAVKGKLTIIAHIACNNTKDSCELAAHAESQGVDAIAAIPPIYFHLPEYAIAEYWNDISAAAPNTPFIIYNIGVKNSSMATQDIQMFKTEAGKDHIVFNGPDEQFISGRAIGADGGIGGTYAVMPELFLKMNEFLEEGKMKEALEIQNKADAIIYKMCEAHGNLYAVMKEILRINENIDIGNVRKPLPGLIPEDIPIVEEAAKMIRDAISELQSSMQSGRFSAGYFIYSNSINYYKMVSVPEMVR